MLAEKIMVTDLVTAHQNELVSDVFTKMRDAKLRMLPVLDDNGCIVGIISTFCIMEHIVPDYVKSGDLHDISFAPDMGILHRHYDEVSNAQISTVMNKKPLLVNRNESILSVASTLTNFGRHEYAMVIDKGNQFLGVISAGDILDQLLEKSSEVNDA